MINEYQAKKYCKDDLSLIENYEQAISDPTQIWDLHHQLELTLDGEFAHSREELIRLNMYYNRPYFELIFVTHSEHQRLHNKVKSLSDEVKQKRSVANKGENNPMYGKHHSEESRKKMSAARKGKSLSEETRKKISGAHKGKPSSRKGKSLSVETRKKMSESAKRRWLRMSEIKLSK